MLMVRKFRVKIFKGCISRSILHLYVPFIHLCLIKEINLDSSNVSDKYFEYNTFTSNIYLRVANLEIYRNPVWKSKGIKIVIRLSKNSSDVMVI